LVDPEEYCLNYCAHSCAHDLEQRTGLPVKTIYACLQELYTNTYIEELDRPRNKRGRPRVKQTQSTETDRYRSRYVIEDMSRGYDHIITAESSMNYPVAPGNVDYPAQFPDVWHKIVETEEENEICTILLRFVEKVQRRINDYSSDEVRKWAPTTKIDFCCSMRNKPRGKRLYTCYSASSNRSFGKK
jgi:hypothetical protein